MPTGANFAVGVQARPSSDTTCLKPGGLLVDIPVMAAPISFRLREYLPGKERLDERTWEVRHRFMLGLLWLHVPFLAAIGILRGQPPLHVLFECSLVALSALAAGRFHGRSARAMVVTFGLLSSSGILVHFTGGLIESHFHFFVMVTVVALYQDWKPLLLAVGYVAMQHGILGILQPKSVYNHPAALANPLLWALIHAAYILFLVGILLSNWRLADKAELERSTSELRFRRSFEEAPIGMGLADSSARFLQVNRALSRMLGYETQQLVGSTLASVTHADDHSTLNQAWETITSGEKASANLELRCLTITGSGIWARLSLSTLPQSGGKAPMALVQIEDVTSAHEDRERLERLVAGKDEFVASVSREIRDPLAAVLGLAEEMRSQHLTEKETSEFLATIADQAREIAHIVDDLLVASRAGQGAIPVVASSVELEGLCRDSLAEVGGAEGVSIEVDGARVWADPERTRQILRNLIGNAVRYGGPSVQIRAVPQGGDTLVQVCDNGPEIPVGERERIFHADLRNGTPVTEPASVGLGLTVSRHLARLMSGDLSYRRSTDELSVFELRLPSGPPAET